MAFQLSPGVLVVEKDLTGIVPAVATSIGGYVGAFQWGPVDEITTLSNEGELVRTFGKPNDTVASSWFSAANFLSYANNLKVVRTVGTAAKNAVATGTALLIKNENVWEATYSNGSAAVGQFAAKFPGELGNSLKVSVADFSAFRRTLAGTATATTGSTAVTGVGTSFTTEVLVGEVLKNAAGTVIGTVATITDNTNLVLVANAAVAVTGAAISSGPTTEWEHKAEFDSAPGTSAYVASLGGADDELHIVVIDEDGLWTGTAGTILEKFGFLSKAADAKKGDGSTAFYVEVLRGSRYIHWMDHPAASNWGSNAQGTTFTATGADDFSLTGGVSDDAPSDAAKIAGWDLFANAERVDVNLVFNGPSSLTVGKHIVENIAQTRMDCIAFVSPTLGAVYNNPGDEADDIIAERQDAGFNVNSSYGVMDTGWKYQYDKYNDKYRWVPLNADLAGLCARTDTIADPWFSPGGLNRGQIKNVVKLAFSPDKTDRDSLYKAGVNPVVTFLGEGTVLFGDKTLLAKPSAFDRINVRRLFIVLEKAIATAGKYQLFEFNDAFTRAQFRNLVEPFLRDVKGRRGIYDFKVVCDETNNTGEVIDRNEFVADIYIKPARSINFMQLNFIATRTGVSFEEVVGA